MTGMASVVRAAAMADSCAWPVLVSLIDVCTRVMAHTVPRNGAHRTTDRFERRDDMGGKPSRQTSKDMRLKANRTSSAAPKPAPKAATVAPLKFGSPAWRAKYGK